MSQEPADKKDIVIQANANFHHVCGSDLFNKEDQCFKEYRQKWKEWPKNFYVGPFPLFVDVEVTSVCNLRCSFCATTYRGDQIDKGFIKLETIKRIVDECVLKGAYGIKFNIRGEPLLHPQIHEFVAYAKEKGLIDVYFNTNAMLMTPQVSEKLINAGLDRLSISFEGYTKEVYEKYRQGADFETVLKNIVDFQELKKKYKTEYPKIRIQAVMLDELKSTFEEYKDFWVKRVDEIAFLDYKEMKGKKKSIVYSWACPQIFQRMGIWWDGTMLPCNHDDEGGLSLGNVEELSLEEAWKSKEFNMIRQLHKQGLAHQIPVCDGCYLRDSEINKIIDKGVNS